MANHINGAPMNMHARDVISITYSVDSALWSCAMDNKGDIIRGVSSLLGSLQDL